MRPLLKGRSVRIIVTMGMPAPVFRLVFGAFGLRAVERGMLWICGFAPVRHLVLGGVGAGSQTRRLKAVEALGARAR